ncbi:type IV pilin protein [Uliginosibacterium sp. H1]|uniref:type IV pilin protein n=1 Tax=Uliginosibacterium sp. H1 TaxID=3114757 RepID=UPI002E184519|nr:type IV pilin protein [Uliginosibacterium sp. H1]
MTGTRTHQHSQSKQKSKGFTLIELMITVAIIGILAGIALPAYSDYVTRGRLTDGQKILSTYALAMEQYFQNHNSYASGGSCGVNPDTRYDTADFAITCATDATVGYVATATGQSRVNGYTYTINGNGARATTAFANGGVTAATCWQSRKSGTC